MISVSTFLSVRALLEEGVARKEIARRLGIDVRTVRKWCRRLVAGDATVPERERGPSKLDPYQPRIEEMVERGMSAVQIHAELSRLEGFAASYVTLRRLVRELRRLAPEVYCRMTYAPGEEGQVDFADVGRLEHGGRLVRVWLFVLTLCYSRVAYYELVLDQTVPTFLGALRRGFEFFGGAPERIKPDNLKAAVLLDQLGQRYYQEDFFRFCRHYGTTPDAARPHTPTDKGRVERDIRYARGSFFRGRPPGTLEGCRADLRAWSDGVANVRLHGTTQRRPVDLLEEERRHLRPLPVEAYEIAQWGLFRVRKDCHVAVRGNHYSVPWRLVGERVLVRLTETRVTAFAEGAEVASHARAEGRGRTVTDASHYPPEKRISNHEIHRRRTIEVRSAGPHAAQYLARLKASRCVHSEQVLRLARLVTAYGAVAFEKACERALFFDATSEVDALERVLERRLYEEALLPPTTARRREPAEDFGRPLAEYAALIEEAIA